MRWYWCAALLSFAAGACAAQQKQDVGPPASSLPLLADERLGIDDVIEVRVIGEGDLSGPYRVSTDGDIFFPYLGHLQVAGLRPNEVQQLITEKLRDGYLRNPQVTLAVTEWNSRRVFVLGQVQKPGPIPYRPNMTIVDAIASAGGFTPVAAQNAVKLRRELNGRVETATLRVGDISEGRQPNVIVLPRDVLFVEERIF